MPPTSNEFPDHGELADEDDEHDHGDLGEVLAQNSLTDEEQRLYPLFAKALDPNDPETIEDVENRWREVGDALSDGSS